MNYNKKFYFRYIFLSLIIGFLLLNCIFFLYLQYPCSYFYDEAHFEKANSYYPTPIDIVYTWVNGSDEQLLKKINFYRANLYLEKNEDFNSNRLHCPFTLCGLNNHFLISSMPRFEFHLEDFTKLLKEALSLTLKSSNATLKFITKVNRSTFSRKSGIVFQSSLSISHLFLNESELPIEISGYPQHKFLISQIYIANANASIGHPIDDHVFLSGLPEIRDVVTEENWRLKLSGSNLNGSNLIKVSASGFLLILPDNISANQFNRTFNASSISENAYLSRCVLILDMSLVTIISEISTSRFQDNEEFKYSLRSLDKFVDFYRHIFVVTNGQVPSWLNTNHPKITVVPHQSIFRNKSHLPTFNSAAIEANLYNIPGLAPNFIYLNDDVFFGRKIYPEDFYSPSSGYKIYLGWSVPSCVEACPSSWLADGFCDHDCNLAECQWDGGDCIKTKGSSGMAINFDRNSNNSLPQNDNFQNLLQGKSNEFCSPGCNSKWLGDRYCDQPCNIDRCGYDIGDCGDVNIRKLPSAVIVLDEENLISISNDTAAFVLDFREVIRRNENVTSATIDDEKAVLASSYAVKYRLLTVVFNNLHSCKGCKVTQDLVIAVNVTVSLGNNSIAHINRKLVLNCDLLCPRTTKRTKVTRTSLNEIIKGIIVNSAQDKHQRKFQKLSFATHVSVENVSFELLEWERPVEMTHFRLLLQDGLISIDGYQRLVKELWMSYSNKRTRSISLTAFNNDLRIEELSWGFLPWEKNNLVTMRQIRDLYADSLRHSNKILSEMYSVNQRRVPAHGPHFINTEIFTESRNKFIHPWSETLTHRFRSPNDVQFAFMYFQYMMNENLTVPVTDVLDSIDTDQSRSLNENELRTLALRISSNETVFDKIIEEILNGTRCNCMDSSRSTTKSSINISISQLITCLNWSKFYQPQQVSKYPFTTHDDTELAFIMISNNHNKVLRDLNGLRKTPKKFFCLNDNLVDKDNNEQLVGDIRKDVNDFLRFMFPQPSQFERQFPVHYRRSRSIYSLIMGALLLLLAIFFVIRKISVLMRNFLWNSRGRNFNILF